MIDLPKLRARYAAAAAADDGSAVGRERHVEAACGLIVALVEELEDAEAERVQATLPALLADDARLGAETWSHLLTELGRIGAGARALKLASPASALERAAQRVDDPQLASEMERSLARAATGDAALAHARKSLEHAMETVEAQVVADATSFLCELLVERGELAEAKKLLEDRPPTRDGRADRALYDEIRRRLDEHVPDPPDELEEPAELEPAVRAALTKPTNLARAIADGGLPAAHKIREWSSGHLHRPSDLESQIIFGPVRSYWCACGRFRGREYLGMTCHRCGVDIVHAKQRRARTGHIELAKPVVHPWYAAAAAALLARPQTEISALAIGELRAALAAVDLAALTDRYKYDIVTAPKAKLADEAGRKLALVEAFRQAHAAFGTRPESLILEVVIVAPPHGELSTSRLAVRDAYALLLDAKDEPRAVEAVFAALAAR